jgi:hypothetical protein
MGRPEEPSGSLRTSPNGAVRPAPRAKTLTSPVGDDATKLAAGRAPGKRFSQLRFPYASWTIGWNQVSVSS